MRKKIADRKGKRCDFNVIVNISCIYTFCHLLTPLLLSESYYNDDPSHNRRGVGLRQGERGAGGGGHRAHGLLRG